MISVVIPALNEEARLAQCLTALVPAAIDGLVKEVIVSDGGSRDRTRDIAEDAGARVVISAKGRGLQLIAGGDAARGDWLMFLHGDTVLSPMWEAEVGKFVENAERRDQALPQAGVFTLRFDSPRIAARIVAAGAMIRTRLFSMPYGDQGLLISRRFYDALGGYAASALFEDVDIIERIVADKGRSGLHVFQAYAVTSAEKYERNGYVRQVLDNAWRIARYKTGGSPDKIAKGYGALEGS
ncbi:MAG: TIGR04283 family arsenosugar biosynthesis glycosyltransferase [Pseudomonadota bacterium]